MRFAFLPGLLVLCVLFAGCADIEIPRVKQILKEPLGGGSLKTGMKKGQVVSVYGEPAAKTIVNSDDWSQEREEWFYSAKYSVLPVNAGYLSEDLYLYFDGESLTNISRKSLAKQEE